MITNLGRWQIEHDLVVTKSCFDSYQRYDCPCEDCRDLLSAFDLVFPIEFKKIALEFGVDLHKPSEWFSYGRHKQDRCLFAGWYHIVGKILSGEDAWRKTSERGRTENFFALTETFSYGFSDSSDILPESFKGKSVIQLDFLTTVPWLSSFTQSS